MSKTLIPALVKLAQGCSRSIASMLYCCESLLQAGATNDDRKRRSARSLSGKELLLLVGDDWRMGPDGLRQVANSCEEQDLDELEERLANLVLAAWNEEVRAKAAQRPDVLALTCRLLSDPNRPHSYEVMHFAIVLSLRTLYRVPHTSVSLRKFRTAYEQLRARFGQQRRRQLRTSTLHDQFLLDILSLEGAIHRSLTGDNLRRFYDDFQRYPFGVQLGHGRTFVEGHDQKTPELTGSLPDFSTLVNIAFTQPTSISGLDDVIGGFLPTIRGTETELRGGLVTLVAGPPGSGKTTLCLILASRLAEFGSVVSYVATEEEPEGLGAKLTSIGEAAVGASWSMYNLELDDYRDNLRYLNGSVFPSLSDLSGEIQYEVASDQAITSNEDAGSATVALFLLFPRVVIIDSLTALLHGNYNKQDGGESQDDSNNESVPAGRRELARTLESLRANGVCVFLVGGLEDCEDRGLAYLVDNVFRLTTDAGPAERHPMRILSIDKTRLQTSHRGQHVFHLSRHEGFVISPSLHSALRTMRGRAASTSDPGTRAVIWANASAQLTLPGARKRGEVSISIRGKSQVLVYGRGSAGKARFGMSVAFEPRVDMDSATEWDRYVTAHSQLERQIQERESEYLSRARVLVVSFLYEERFYREIASSLIKARFRKGRKETQDILDTCLTVLDYYPGYFDAETLLARVRQSLWGARLEGRPYTAIVIDGVHNILFQFPFLQREPLLWPTLYRLFRAEGVETVTTFSFFQKEQFHGLAEPTTRSGGMRSAFTPSENVEVHLEGADRLFHLLVSSCDYSFLVERPYGVGVPAGSPVLVHLGNSVDSPSGQPLQFWWDPMKFRYH